MAIDLSGAKGLGINLVAGTNQYTGKQVGNLGGKAAPAPKANFVGNVLHSAAHIAGGAVSAAVNGGAKAFLDTAHGISEGMPHFGSIAQNQHATDQALKDLDRAHKTYAQQYSAGKITKDRYHKLLTDLGKQYADVSHQSGKNSKTTSAKDFGLGLATVASLPFAGGNLVGESTAAKALGATAEAKSGMAAAALKAPVKAALIDAPVAQAPVQIASDIHDKNYAGAAENAAALVGAPVAFAAGAKVLPKAAEAVGTAMFGKAAGPIKAFFGDKAVENAAQDPRVAGLLKQAEGFTMSQPGVKKPEEASKFFEHYMTKTLGLEKGKVTPEEFANRFEPYAKTLSKLQDAKAAGTADARTALTAKYADALPAAIRSIGADYSKLSPQERVSVVKQAMEEAHIVNPTVRDSIGNAAFHSESIDDFKKTLTALDKHGVQVEGVKPPKGFQFTYGPKAQAVLPSAEAAPELAAGKGANPILGKVGSTLEKAGLSPRGTDNAQVRGMLTDNLEQHLQGTKFEGMGKKVLNALNDTIGQTKGIFDPRLLKISAIEDSLGVSTADAKAVRNALDKAYSDVPLAVRGLGNKVTDKAIEKIGVGPVSLRNYIKAKGYGRFTGNPIFWIKRDIKSELIAQAESGGKAPNFGKAINKILGTAPSDSTIKALENDGKFARGGVHAGEADFFGNLFDGTSASAASKNAAPQYIRQSMGQLAESFAKQRGTTVEKIVEEGGQQKEELDHLLQMTVGYPKDGYLNSNLAKTLNVALFPSRFETKVMSAGVKYLSKQPPVVQAAVVKGMMNADGWLKSDQGKQWKRDNSELIGLVNYFTPTETIANVFETLTGRPHPAGDLGSFGGMPFDFIGSMLKGQGVNVPGAGSSPYYNPKTGDLVPDKIPQGTKARMQQGLVDLVSSMFSFPGRTAGLPSKTEVVQKGSLGTLAIDKKSQKSVYPAGVPKHVGPPAPGTTPAAAAPVVRKATQFGYTPPTKTNAVIRSLPSTAKAPKAKRVKPKAFKPRLLP